MSHKSGFVNIVGSPNVGKSTLLNQLMGEKLSIVSSKAQTTRHRILGLLNDENYQIVFSDTPGVVNASYELHNVMMSYVDACFQDADIIILITDVFENELNHVETLQKIQNLKIPTLCLINKIDLKDQQMVGERLEYWKNKLTQADVFPISALHGFNVDVLKEKIIDLLPESPPYYDKESISDRPVRFFVAEIIREKIFLNLKKEVPYACQVDVTEYLEENELIKIRAIINVERESQKGILIGSKGKMLKYIGIDARREIQKFVGKKVFLETIIKVDKDWRNSEVKLRKYGYKS